MADQCIVCLDNLDVVEPAPPPLPTPDGQDAQPALHPAPSATPTPPSPSAPAGAGAASPPAVAKPSTPNNCCPEIAVIDACGHLLHDACLRQWTGKANSCPICRQTFHLVHVYDKVGGTKLSSYSVEDKKQIAEFDPQVWLDENPEEEEETRPCPICNFADNEDVLLLCDQCDAGYHTYCVGLDEVPRGHWFCMECAGPAAEAVAAEMDDPDVTAADGLAGFSDERSDYMPRTQASMRRARRRARSDEWTGAWGQIAGRIYDVLSLDIDGYDDNDALRSFRESQNRREQNRREQERRERQRWQQRLDIASRLGARDIFARNLPPSLQHVARRQSPPPPPPPPQETPEERQAWGALERAMDDVTPASSTTPNRRKRKSRSVTASPVEPVPQPERKLKRPRTRRVPTQGEASSSKSPVRENGQSVQAESSAQAQRRSPPRQSPPRRSAPRPSPPRRREPLAQAPSFLTSLLQEVEASTPSDDENVRALLGTTSRAAPDPSSPVTSPAPSAHSSPRALSTTPPPRGIGERSGSPLSLTSRIEPLYPRANYSPPPRDGSDTSDSESRARPLPSQRQAPPAQQQSPQPLGQSGNGGTNTNVNPQGTTNGASRAIEIRQPRPRRHPTVNISHQLSQAQDVSPTRASLPFETKESISRIVKDALKPHWKSHHISADQYATINRDLSRKLYEQVTDKILDEEVRNHCEKIASTEVAKAISELSI